MAENPTPPYEGYLIPERFRNTPYDGLPPGIKRRFDDRVDAPESREEML